ncbi:YraN family protein [Microbacterium hibisci]|uniref:YraN family protein n=1 Tax=Microbacterium hibisci TaxID=2036000 RepID=UPI001944A440|nr:YraN family protein [Microbacterium hibisci]
MADKDDLGRAGEDRAARYFEERGFTVLARNWRCRDGEIDLVVADRMTVAVVEVKTRRGEGFGHPFEAIDARKRVRLWRLAVAWASAHRDLVQGRRLRIDAVGLTGATVEAARLEHLVDVEVP